MYYDVNISPGYLEQDVDELERSEFHGFCINRTVRSSEFGRWEYEPCRLALGKRCYNRVEVEFEENDQIGYEQRKAMKSDMFVVKLNGTNGLDKLIKLQPDMVTFNYASQTLLLKHGLVRAAIKENIFFEIPMRDGLCGGEASVVWMKNVRRLLFITNGKNVVVSSGARRFTEIKKCLDIVRMLEMFGMRKKRAEEILRNSERLLKNCAMRRYCHKGTVVHSVDEGALKRDFVLSLYRS